MALGRQAHPVRGVVKVDQADGLRQIGEQRRGEVVIVAGADKEQFRPVRRALWSVFQLLCKALVVSLSGPQTQLRAERQQVDARGTAIQ